MDEKPKLVLAGFSAYTKQLDYKKFQDIAKNEGNINDRYFPYHGDL